jgi:hypothetical protein
MKEKGIEIVANVTSAENGEHVAIFGASSSDNWFVAPEIILRGKHKRGDWSFGLLPGCEIYMKSQKAYGNTGLFGRWFKKIVLPRRAPGANLLILDGQVSHCSSPELLKFAK